MVTAEMWKRFLEEQKIKEKKHIEKEEAEKKYKEAIKKYATKRKLEGIFYKKEKKIRPRKIRPRRPEIRPLEKPEIEEMLKKIAERLKKAELKEEEILQIIEKRKKRILYTKSKKKLCGSLQEIVSEVEDPESIFKDIDFVREYTGCEIPIKKKKKY